MKTSQDIIRKKRRKRWDKFLEISGYVFLFMIGVGISLLIYK